MSTNLNCCQSGQLHNKMCSVWSTAGPGGIEMHAWGLLSTALTEVLSKSHWLKLWDHVFSNSPPFLMFLLLSYLMYFRAQIMSAETMQQMEGITRRCNPLDLNKVTQHLRDMNDWAA